MKEAVLILPTQLFEKNELITRDRLIIFYEHPTYFTHFEYHVQKIILHQASMKSFEEKLKKQQYKTIYIPYDSSLEKAITEKEIDLLYCFDPVDIAATKTIKKLPCKTVIEDSPAFLLKREDVEFEFEQKKHFSFTSFYAKQRRNFKILMDHGKPIGGKLTFDTENRKKIPATIKIPRIWLPSENEWVSSARSYVKKEFPKNPGSDAFIYPVTHHQAREWLDDFLIHRLTLFGPYQDGMVPNEPFLFHSMLSPLLNIGLLTPEYVITKTLFYAHQKNVPLNSLEGFVRQILGWREFIRAVYLVAGEHQRKANFFDHTRKLPSFFWDFVSGITPLDDAFNNIHRYAYSHHIQRLMVLGNFMLLCGIDPTDAYNWFMEFFIDAYDWVMVPNVYGMSQYADGGLMTTKPYISSSNYILKMSSYKKGEWCPLWDGLYWNFISSNSKTILKNPRLAIMAYYLKSIKKDALKKHLLIAEKFFSLF